MHNTLATQGLDGASECDLPPLPSFTPPSPLPYPVGRGSRVVGADAREVAPGEDGDGEARGIVVRGGVRPEGACVCVS